MEQNLRIVEVLRAVAEKHEKTLAACAIRWILVTLPDSIVIAGVKRPAQLESNVEAIGWGLSRKELKRLDEVSG